MIDIEKHSNNSYSWYYPKMVRRHNIPLELAKEIIALNQHNEKLRIYVEQLEKRKSNV